MTLGSPRVPSPGWQPCHPRCRRAPDQPRAPVSVLTRSRGCFEPPRLRGRRAGPALPAIPGVRRLSLRPRARAPKCWGCPPAPGCVPGPQRSGGGWGEAGAPGGQRRESSRRRARFASGRTRRSRPSREQVLGPEGAPGRCWAFFSLSRFSETTATPNSSPGR